MIKIDSLKFQEEFDKSVERGLWTETIGEYILVLVDNIARSGILRHNGTDDAINEIKGFAVMNVLEGLWTYEQSSKKSRAMYYAIAIIKNTYRKFGRECFGANAVKTLQGTDSFTMVFDENIGRYRKAKVDYIDYNSISNYLIEDDKD